MLIWLAQWLQTLSPELGFFRVFQYLTMRALMAALTALLLGLVRLDGEAVEVALVYPEEADDSAGKLSVCSDVGTAILGYKEGDAFDWRMTHRTRHVRIEKVLYQPEAAGHFHL